MRKSSELLLCPVSRIMTTELPGKRKAEEEISGCIESGHSGSKIWKPTICCVIGRIVKMQFVCTFNLSCSTQLFKMHLLFSHSHACTHTHTCMCTQMQWSCNAKLLVVQLQRLAFMFSACRAAGDQNTNPPQSRSWFTGDWHYHSASLCGGISTVSGVCQEKIRRGKLYDAKI